MFDRRLVQYFDWGLLMITLTLGGLGLVVLYSAVNAGTPSPLNDLCSRQMIWFCVGLLFMVATFTFSYRLLDQWGIGVYFASMALLAYVLIDGRIIAGSRRWLVLGPLRLQPSELAKIAVIIILAKYYSSRVNIKGFTIRDLIGPVVLVLVPFLLIVKEPDLGTALVIGLIAVSMTFYVKIERRTLLYFVIACAIVLPLVWFFLKGYQQQRILTFLDPNRDPLGAGYHIIQSKIAIGSGMVFGKGFLKGTQNALSFLPEQHTDFIISVLAEEWGFVGTAVLLLLYLLLIVWGINIAMGCRDSFGTILSVGVTSMIFWQAFINMGMVMGLMPVVGVPLPLVSYGGSSVVTFLIGIGILLNISMRRFMIE